MQDTFCLSVNSKFSFGATAGKERGLLTSLAVDMKSAEEGKTYYFDFTLLLKHEFAVLALILIRVDTSRGFHANSQGLRALLQSLGQAFGRSSRVW